MADEVEMGTVNVSELAPGTTGISHDGTIYTADGEGVITAPQEAIDFATAQAARGRPARERRNRVNDVAPNVGMIPANPYADNVANDAIEAENNRRMIEQHAQDAQVAEMQRQAEAQGSTTQADTTDGGTAVVTEQTAPAEEEPKASSRRKKNEDAGE